MITLHHAKLVRRDWAEVEKLRALVKAHQAGQAVEAVMLHNHNGACCNAERFETTWRLLTQAMTGPPPNVTNLASPDREPYLKEHPPADSSMPSTTDAPPG